MHDIFWTSCAATHVGKIRKINQDAYLNLPDRKLWMVADGMGGHEAGELASTAIINALKTLTEEKFIGAMASKIYRELLDVNRMLVEMAAGNGKDVVIGSTIAILLAYRRNCICLWSGDSRIYLLRKGKLRQITRDHIYASQLLAEGYSSSDVEKHLYAQTLTHAVGADIELYLEAQLHEFRPGDIYLLCSDGLNKEVSDAEIEAILNTTPMESAVSKLMEMTLTRGARDNTTIVLAGC